MKFIRHIYVPSLNYAAYIDDENTKDKYNTIDDEIYEMAGGLLLEDLKDPSLIPKDKIVDLLVLPKEAGGMNL